MAFPFSRRNLLRAAVAGSAALFAGCSPLAILNAAVPSRTYRLRPEIAYGSDPRHVLDVYVPAHASAHAPVVMFFYGGNWNSGERGSYVFVGEALASKGYIAVIPDYRLYPQVRYPDFLDDCALAVRWTFDHIGAEGGDAQRVFLMGHSAGAYNAAMLALNREYLRGAGVDAGRIRGLIGLAGPYDFLPLTGAVTKAVFGFPNTSITTQPIHYVSSEAPPALFATGSDDDVVDPGNSARLAARLRAKGVDVRTPVYAGLGHRTLVGALAAPLRGFGSVLEDVAEFVDSIVKWDERRVS